jgi:hypothetical protein
MPNQFDGVIEAVRYKGGQIALVRAYERRGATFSDHILLDRKTLLERLKQGRRFITGQRKELWASTFTVGKSVQALRRDGKDVLATRPDAERDELENVPAF